jgi:hypothetical protein
VSRWDIDPAGVSSVVTRTGGVAQGFEGAASKYAGALEGAAGACGSEIVGAALAGFAESQQRPIESIVKRCGNVLTGAVEATKAYLAGDLEMAAEAQRNAAAGR